MTARTAFLVGQHVHNGSAIYVVCTPRDSRYGGVYQVKHINPRYTDPGAVETSHRAQEWYLKPLVESDLCRKIRHGCGRIHVQPDFVIATGWR